MLDASAAILKVELSTLSAETSSLMLVAARHASLMHHPQFLYADALRSFSLRPTPLFLVDE